jgi:hypothetical protein
MEIVAAVRQRIIAGEQLDAGRIAREYELKPRVANVVLFQARAGGGEDDRAYRQRYVPNKDRGNC